MLTSPSTAQLKLGVIADELTRTCLSYECRTMSITPWNWRAVFKFWRPDILFVESAWNGQWNSWRYRIASYPEAASRNNLTLSRVVNAAHEANIPAVFWNREDGAHYERFIASARLFDRVLTVDENMLERYRTALNPGARVGVMMFAAQPALHAPNEGVPSRRASFVGSYSSHVHPTRRAWQDTMFEASKEIGLTVYDRNSKRRAPHYRYPNQAWIEVRRAIPHTHTAEVYRRHSVNLNVNTVTSSATGFSRRLVEILACGSFALTNPTPAVSKYFADYCVATNDPEEARVLFARIAREGLSKREQQQALAGAEYIRRHHTWRHRLIQILDIAR